MKELNKLLCHVHYIMMIVSTVMVLVCKLLEKATHLLLIKHHAGIIKQKQKQRKRSAWSLLIAAQSPYQTFRHSSLSFSLTSSVIYC